MARILIADDNETDRLALHAFLERTGHEVVEAQDGEEALREYLRARMRAESIQVVITDLQMPQVHGLHVIMLLRDLSPRPAIIAMSGTGGEQLEMAYAIGADVVLAKPIDPTELMDAVAEALAVAPAPEAAAEASELSTIAFAPEPDRADEPDVDATDQGIGLDAPEVQAEPVFADEPEPEPAPEHRDMDLDALELQAEPVLADEPEPAPEHRDIDLDAFELQPEPALAAEPEPEASYRELDLDALGSEPEPSPAEDPGQESAYEDSDLGALLLGPEPGVADEPESGADDEEIGLHALESEPESVPTDQPPLESGHWGTDEDALDFEPERVPADEPGAETPHQGLDLDALELERQPVGADQPGVEAESEGLNLDALELEPEPLLTAEPEPEALYEEVEPGALELEPEVTDQPGPGAAYQDALLSAPLPDPDPRAVEEDLGAGVDDEATAEDEAASEVAARILIVDDNEADRLVLSTILERAGHQTFTAEDGKRALWVYGGKVIDLVITDLQMPRVHGLDLIKVLADLSPRPKIIAISGVDTDDLPRAKSLGADATLTKPVDADELLEAVRTVVASSVRTDPVIIDSFKEQGN